MTIDEKRARRREYMREWRQRPGRANREREYKINSRRRKAMAGILATRSGTK